jgi:hypothetical protein
MSEVQETPGTEVVEKQVQETQGTEVKTPEIKTPASGDRGNGWVADDWRERIAGQDTKMLERLKRFSDPAALANSYRELEVRQSQAKLQPVLPDNATEAQLAAYRKELGVPEKPEDYEIDFEEGLVFGKEDEPLVGYMLEVMHNANTPPAIANAVVNGYFKLREAEATQFAEQQEVIRLQTDDRLREIWGGNYRTNIATIQNMLKVMPNGAGDMIMNARLANGQLLANNYEAITALAQLATDLYPAATVVPGGTGDQLQNIEGQLAEFKKMRQTDINAWHKNLPAKARERELLDAQMKLKARG